MYPNTFYRVSVKALVKNEQNQILVVKENQDTWSLPGGGLDHGENPIDGVRRELKEELGVESASIDQTSACYTFYLENKKAWLLWVVYNVTVDSKQPFTKGEGVTDIRFIDPKSLESSTDIFEKMVHKVCVESI